MTTPEALNLILSHCAYCGKVLQENEGINGGVIYPQIWCNEEHKELWLQDRVAAPKEWYGVWGTNG